MYNRRFTWTKSLRGSYSLYNMDVEFGSDLSEIEKVEIIGHAGWTSQSYLYEPVSRVRPESNSDSEPNLSDSSFVFSEDDDACTRCFNLVRKFTHHFYLFDMY